MSDIVDRLREPVMLRYNAEQINTERREAADELERLREQFASARDHVGWLKQYHLGMTEENWCDMKLRSERQLVELSSLLTDDLRDAEHPVNYRKAFRKASASARLRGGPMRDYECNDPNMVECASSKCQALGRCAITSAKCGHE